MADVTVMRTPAETRLSQQFETTKGTLPGDPAEREEAFRLFSERGLPHRRIEEFKYTDLRALIREAAPLAGKPSSDAASGALAQAAAFAGCGAVRIATVNGHLVRAE